MIRRPLPVPAAARSPPAWRIPLRWRRPASRYIATDPLTGYLFGAGHTAAKPRDGVPGAWNNLEGDFAKHPPLFIVDTESGPTALYPVGKFPVIARLLAERYRLVYRAADGIVYRRLEGP